MDTVKAEHDINELKLQSLKAEVDKVQGGSPPAAAGLADGSNSSTSAHPSTLSPPPSNVNGSTGSPVKPSRSPVDIASQLFSRNKSKSSSSKNKKKSSPRGRATPPAVPSPTTNGQQHSSEIGHLRQEIQNTQADEMKLVSSAIGINPDGNALTEEGHDEVLDLADQLLAQLDAKEDITTPNQSGPSFSNSTGIASGPNTTSNVPLAAPQPINIADNNLNAQNGGVMANMEGSSSLQHASSRQSTTSSTSAISSASTTIPINASSSRSRHSSSSSAPKPTGFGAKLKHALSPHRDDSPASSTSPNGGEASSSDTVTNSTGTTSTSPFSAQTFKNRHALRKEKKKQKEDAMRAEAQAEVEAERANGGVNNKYDAADMERINIDNICRSWNLELIEMEPDGHCMYSAIADQLTSKKITLGDKKEKKKEKEKWDYNNVRKIAADYMRSHMDDFLPYIPAEDIEGQGEGLLSPEGYLKHCDNVEKTSEWGSQTEVRNHTFTTSLISQS